MYQYKIIRTDNKAEFPSLIDVEKKLCELGKEKWMLAFVDSPILYLVREILEEKVKK